MEKGAEVIEGSLEDIIGRTVESVEKYKDDAAEQVKTQIIAEAIELADKFPFVHFVKGYPYENVEERAVVIETIRSNGPNDKSVVLSPAGIHICDTARFGEYRYSIVRVDAIHKDRDDVLYGYGRNQKWLDYGVLAAQVLDMMRQGKFDKDWQERLKYR